MKGICYVVLRSFVTSKGQGVGYQSLGKLPH
jgi:hypothetical protein